MPTLDHLARFAMLALLGWTVVGLAGTGLALGRRERGPVRRGVVSLGVTWVVYLAVLLGVSRLQPERRTMPGAERCFRTMCFSVAGAERLEGFYARNVQPSPLLRVSVRIRNVGEGASVGEAELRPYLVDGQGHRWSELAGLSSVPLTAPVAAGSSVLSRPVFHAPPPESAGLGLVLTHRGFTGARLVIGDPESLGHRPQVLVLPAASAGAAEARAEMPAAPAAARGGARP